VNEYDKQLAGLDEAARRAGAIIIERIEELVSSAERRAGEIHQHAEANAEAVHGQTIESARRVFERLNALEHPLAELATTLKDEKQRFARELDAGPSARELPAGAVIEQPSAADEDTHTEHHPTPETEDEPTPETDGEHPAPQGEPLWVPPYPADGAPPAGDSTDGSETATTDEPDRESPAVATASPPTTKPRRRLFKKRDRPRAFIDAPGECAVCERPFQAESEQQLEASGWRVSDDVGVCPQCQDKGWQLREVGQEPDAPQRAT
jgi:hypothetical protein